jgi:hypothetical protein
MSLVLNSLVSPALAADLAMPSQPSLMSTVIAFLVGTILVLLFWVLMGLVIVYLDKKWYS